MEKCLIHHKSKDAISLFEIETENPKKELKPIYEKVDVSKFFKMLNELFMELDRIDVKGTHLSQINMVLKKI